MLGLGGNEQIRIFGGSASTKFVKKCAITLDAQWETIPRWYFPKATHSCA